MSKAKQTTTDTAQETVANTVSSTEILSVRDIELAKQAIDHAAEQGAFKGWETITTVLNLRNRLDNFIKLAQRKAEENKQKEESNQE